LRASDEHSDLVATADYGIGGNIMDAGQWFNVADQLG